MPECYSTIIFAFATFDTQGDSTYRFFLVDPPYFTSRRANCATLNAGNVVNNWDCDGTGPLPCYKNFTLTRQMVSDLQHPSGGPRRSVLISFGGSAGPDLVAPAPAMFVVNMAKGMLDVYRSLGIDGFDLDIENRLGKAFVFICIQV